MDKHTFQIECAYDKIWNTVELIDFLVRAQGQDIMITTNPEAIDLRNLGAYDIIDCFAFRSVTIMTFNPFEWHDRYTIKFIAKNRFLQTFPQIDPELHKWNRSKIFLGLYGRPSAARLVLASHLYHAHRDKSHVHLRYSSEPNDIVFFEMDKISNYNPNWLVPVSNMIQDLPLEIAPRRFYTNTGYNFDQEPVLTTRYQDIFVDVVGETFVDGVTFFPTEKVVRAMLLKKPFIVYGSECFLEYLRQMGFYTFNDYWNEYYDGYQGPQRLAKIIEVIDLLSAEPLSVLADMLEHMTPLLEHNHRLLQEQTYNYKVSLVV